MSPTAVMNAFDRMKTPEQVAEYLDCTAIDEGGRRWMQVAASRLLWVVRETAGGNMTYPAPQREKVAVLAWMYTLIEREETTGDLLGADPENHRLQGDFAIARLERDSYGALVAEVHRLIAGRKSSILDAADLPWFDVKDLLASRSNAPKSMQENQRGLSAWQQATDQALMPAAFALYQG